jgi:hypothetical protein
VLTRVNPTGGPSARADLGRCHLWAVYFTKTPLLINSPVLKGTSRMDALSLKVLVVVISALVGAVVIHSLVYLSIDAGSLSAQMPVR